MNIHRFFFLVSKSKRKRYFPPPDTRPPPAAPSPHSPPLPDSYDFLGPLRDAFHAPSLPYSVPTKLTASGLRGVPAVGRQQRDGKVSSCSTSTWGFFFFFLFFLGASYSRMPEMGGGGEPTSSRPLALLPYLRALQFYAPISKACCLAPPFPIKSRDSPSKKKKKESPS